jgi:acetyl esterase/lipase
MDDAVPLIKAMLPKVPLIGKTAVWHTLGLSETSQQWDLKTELTVNVLRSFVDGKPMPVSKAQRMFLKDPGVKGKMWISKVDLPAPTDDGVRQALFKAIEGLKEADFGPGGYLEPELLPVSAEWTGYRAGATKNSADLRIPDEQKYTELMKEVTSPATILYFHGGAYYLMDPASHRPTTVKLAKLTKGRCLSIRYRLAPQNPFPAALLDALVSYLSLLYPAPGSFHEPVEAKHIVFSGDSAGGNLSLVLLQTILEIRRQGLKVLWNGEERDVPVPAGIACNSGWFDITHSLPSCDANGKYDYLPTPGNHPGGIVFPPCEVWPTNPPRKNLYAEDEMLCHPLVSPLTAKDWTGAPPMWIETGEELLSDEDRHVAMSAAKQGVTVVYEEYKAMPHCFAMVLQGTEGARKCFSNWAQFIKAAVEQPDSLKTQGTRFEAKTLKETTLDVLELSPYGEDEVVRKLKEAIYGPEDKVPQTMSKL